MRTDTSRALAALTGLVAGIFLTLSLFGAFEPSGSDAAVKTTVTTRPDHATKVPAFNAGLEQQLRQAHYETDAKDSYTRPTQECTADSRDAAGKCPVEYVQRWQKGHVTVTLTDARRPSVYDIDDITVIRQFRTPKGAFTVAWCIPANGDRESLALSVNSSETILHGMEQGVLPLVPNKAVPGSYMAMTSTGTCYVSEPVAV